MSEIVAFDPKQIENQNKKFHKMSYRKQRLAIAEDVLRQIKLKKYVATVGSYVRSYLAEKLINESRQNDQVLDFQKVLLANTPECQVCGLGAAFCSMARLGDEVQMDDSSEIHEHLTAIFGGHQVSLIEHAFEGFDAGGNEETSPISENEKVACRKFFDKRPSDSKRLAAIFRNIIKHDGKFRP